MDHLKTSFNHSGAKNPRDKDKLHKDVMQI